jgi:hypothetical protein
VRDDLGVIHFHPRSCTYGWPGHKMEKKCNGCHLAGSQKKAGLLGLHPISEK